MNTVLTAEEMKQCDYNTINYFGIKGSTLMERASLSVCDELKKHIKFSDKILAFVGTGNNGGDSVCVARLMHNFGFNVSILLCGDEAKFSSDLKEQLDIARRYNISEKSLFEFWDGNSIGNFEAVSGISNFDVYVDGIFGIGLSRNVEGLFLEAIKLFNNQKGYKVAIDIPSGINTNTGQVMGEACKVDATITFNFLKNAHLLYPGRNYSGKTSVCDIGINENSFLEDIQLENVKRISPKTFSLEKCDLHLLNNRNDASNKGDYGKILIIAGSQGMSGAAYFSACAALRMGAGLVKVYTTEDNREILQKKLPEAIVVTYSGFDDEKLQQELSWSNVTVIGPGIGGSKASQQIVKYVLSNYDKHLIIDADAINILSENIDLLQKMKTIPVLTPHMGEMHRLNKLDISEIKSNPLEHAKDFASKYKVCLCLKDAATVVVSGNDEANYINTSGNSGMSTAGSGDVLTGIIAAILGANKHLPQINKLVALAVYFHGLCGDKAASKLGAHSMLASDIIDAISDVLKEGF